MRSRPVVEIARSGFGYFPIIYIQNTRLKTYNGQSGQGILLVDVAGAGKGDLEIENGFTFYELILVKGEFERETGTGTNRTALHGALMVDNHGGTGNSYVGAGGDVCLKVEAC